MAGRKYQEPEPGEWVQPVRKGYRMRCCDCGLVHILDFRIIRNRLGRGKKIQFRVFRDNRATAAIRAAARRDRE